MTKQGYETYKLYLALQRHFSTSYCFFKYNGKVNASADAYSNRPEIFKFEKLTKIIPEDERVDFFVCHFIIDPKMWIGNMSKQTYENYKSKMKNFITFFKDDMELIAQYNPKDLMNTKDTPLIHKLAIDKKINIETIIVMDHFYSFIDKHKEEVNVPFVFPEHIELLINYRPFIQNKITDIHKEVMRQALISE